MTEPRVQQQPESIVEGEPQAAALLHEFDWGLEPGKMRMATISGDGLAKSGQVATIAAGGRFIGKDAEPRFTDNVLA